MTPEQLQEIQCRLYATHTTTVSSRAAARMAISAHAEDDIEALLAEVHRLRDLVAYGPIGIPQEDLYSFLHCAINYALGRRTYITSVVVSQVRRYWDNLTTGQRETLTRNLKADIDGYNRSGALIGDQRDDADWRKLLGWMLDRVAGAGEGATP